MNAIEPQQTEDEAHASQATRNQLARLIQRAISEDGFIEPYPGLSLIRLGSTTQPIHTVFEPSFCVIAQGSKAIFVGTERYVYDPYHYLLVTADLPVMGQILEASKAQPYLTIHLKLDPVMVGSVMAEANSPISRHHANVRAANVSMLDADLLDVVLRLAKLLDKPAEMAFLAPMFIREIIYRLLQGQQGDRLRYIVARGSYTPHIAKAVDRLRKDYNQTLHIERLAQELGMSASGFHHQFKAMTAMSPLQFQKQIRLQEARRLMLGESLDATSAAYRVGYNDASHFGREYKSFFGLPPVQDMERLKSAQ
jgi:AraC-like DNA-binding protein